MKRILLQGITVLSGLISLLALVGLYIIHYFTEKKMGMARHMVYLRSKWRGPQIGPLFLHQWKVLSGMIVLSLLFLTFTKKAFRGKEKKNGFSELLPKLSYKLLILYSICSFLFSYAYFFIAMTLKMREYELSILLLLIQNTMIVLCYGTYLWRTVWLRKN
ncbi:hypothetical protein HNQ46_000318 [Oribacterium sinus]|uniref:Uncharacterized protein n=1 Tax=Oribacterium sinus TaxID=237576 RepID=A0A7W9SDV9_9FIRM|nr:hypothetical protein [Oribacterium sinus]MBB6040357.1 hypothetical protein [Oribacterium sinus]